jgi:acyl carrier protein
VSVEEKVKNIIVEKLSVEPDDVVIVELIMAMEEAFDMEISDDQAEKLQTVQDAMDYIKKHV